MSSLNSRGVWGHSKGPSLRYSLPTSVQVTSDQPNKISMQEVDASAKVFVHVESHQTRDAEGAVKASATRSSVNEPRSSVNRISMADVQQMTAPPAAMSGLHRDRHESRVPFETYNPSSRSNSLGSMV
ncbi:hypothetical protein PM082_017300 [Marasmius tenuissimus]|nr:hypothetical protein PM082_017300 [Marasmius tenuissimus]